MLVGPFVKNRPICAAVWVEEDKVAEPEPTSKLFCRLARNSAGDLFTINYLFDLPVGVTVFDAARALFIVYNTDSPEPTRSPVPPQPRPCPKGFPPEAPSEEPEYVFGIPCYRRSLREAAEEREIWYSYEYDVYARTVSRLPGYGTTVWRLDEVTLGEPPAELFKEASILASLPELIRNISKIAGDFLPGLTERDDFPNL